MRCSHCGVVVEKCDKCSYVFSRLSDVVKCLELENGQKHVHCCNDDCSIDFIFEHNVFDAYTTE